MKKYKHVLHWLTVHFIQIQITFYIIYNKVATATQKTLNEGNDYNIIEQNIYNTEVGDKDIFNLKNTRIYLEANLNR